MRSAVILSAALMLGGCDILADLQAKVEDITNPMLGVAFVTRVDAPTDPDVDLGRTDIEPGIIGTVFFADTQDASNLDDTLQSGLSVNLLGCGQTVKVTESDDFTGRYEYLPGDDALSGCEDSEFSFEVLDPEITMTATVPSGVVVDVPDVHDADTALVLDVEDELYSGAIVRVFRMSDGEETWANTPEEASEFMALISRSETISEIEIPAEAFPDSTMLYGVAVTVLQVSDRTGFSGVNTLFSTSAGGRSSIHALRTRS